MSAVIKVDNVSMMFNLSSEKIDSIKEYIIKMFKRQIHFQEFWALNDVSFELEKGDSLGIIGLNGSGKSTLLKIISGILKPTKGSVKTVGSIAPLIELGAGFDPDLSARENIYLNGAILGYSREYMDSKFDEIIKFAELEDFVDSAIKNYSSGMVARLGFAIAIDVEPQILLVDEILSVGDENFRKKCADKVQELREKGVTFVIVSHNMAQVKQLCQKAIWIENSKVMAYGDASEVCDEYQKYCNEKH